MASMLDCKKVQPLLSEFIDGTLTEETDWSVNLHISSCLVCKQVVGELTATVRLVGTLPVLETSAGFEDALARRLADQVLQPRRESLVSRIRDWWDRPMVRPLVGSAAVLAALIPVALLSLHPASVARQNHVPVAAAASKMKSAEADAQTIDLQQISDDHAFSAATETLGGRSGGVLADANTDITTSEM